MRTIHIMSGLPASGKSTFCEKQGRIKGDVVIHRDDVRAILRAKLGSDEYFPCPANQEYEFFIDHVVRAIKETDKDVWIDQTTLSSGAALKLLFALDKHINLNNFVIWFEVMRTPATVCIERDNRRTGYEHVGEGVINDMNNGFNISLEAIARKTPHHINHNMGMRNHLYKEEKYE